jgi:hypothetical protein
MSLELIDSGARLNEFYHLLTIDFYFNKHLQCDCNLQPFIQWLKTPPPPLIDFYEPLQKFIRIECPISLFDLPCDENNAKKTRLYSFTHSAFFKTLFMLSIFILIVFTTLKLIDRRMKQLRSRFYQRVYTDADIITLNERHVTHKTEEE